METLEKIQNSHELTKKLANIYDWTMPKKKGNKGRRAVYWWNQKITQLRTECIRIRMEYTRNSRRSIAENLVYWENYKESKRTLRNSNKKAKRECWRSLLENVENDIWRDGYKIVMRSILGFPPKYNLRNDILENAVKYLFPVHQDVIFNCDSMFLDLSIEEICTACSKMKINKALHPVTYQQR